MKNYFLFFSSLLLFACAEKKIHNEPDYYKTFDLYSMQGVSKIDVDDDVPVYVGVKKTSDSVSIHIYYKEFSGKDYIETFVRKENYWYSCKEYAPPKAQSEWVLLDCSSKKHTFVFCDTVLIYEYKFYSDTHKNWTVAIETKNEELIFHLDKEIKPDRYFDLKKLREDAFSFETNKKITNDSLMIMENVAYDKQDTGKIINAKYKYATGILGEFFIHDSSETTAPFIYE